MTFDAHDSSTDMRRDERAIIDGSLPFVIAAPLLSVAVLPMAMVRGPAGGDLAKPDAGIRSRPPRIVLQAGSHADRRSIVGARFTPGSGLEAGI